ncbi:hypothetical protein ACFQX7_30250 [Luedemannella flava]
MGCLLLTPFTSYPPPGGGYLLIGGDRKVLVPGARVQVTGVLKPGAISFCMQGYPLEVISAKPLSTPRPVPAARGRAWPISREEA